MKKSVIIVAGGNGSRMNSNIPKQFLKINGKPILLHTIQKFRDAVPDIQIVLVLPEQEISRWKSIAEEYHIDFPITIAQGGATRFESVKSGLEKITDTGIVGIHDAVRPLVAVETIQNCYATAAEKGSAVPVVELKDSIRKVEVKDNLAVPRQGYRTVQTPQCFNFEMLQKAFNKATSSDFTDDASVFESAGNKIHLVKGNEENIKITTAFDLQIAEILLKRKE